MTRIVQVANFVAPHSGGIRTVLDKLARGYADAGHEVIRIVPGAEPHRADLGWGRPVTLPGQLVPGTGYRLLGRARTQAVLARFAPERLEVHDRSTLRGLGRWAKAAGVPSVVVSHERLDRLLEHWLHVEPASRRLADRSNLRLAQTFDAVACTTEWAAAEFARLPVGNVHLVPLGVDRDVFGPHAVDPVLRAQLARPGQVLLVLASRLSPEKRPGIALDAVRELAGRGLPVRLAVAGDGPLRHRLHVAARDLPVEFLGHLDQRADVAALLASADVVLAPGPVETFGLAAVEALACGTAVVVNGASALPEVVGPAGLAAPGTGAGFADAVETLLARPVHERRTAAFLRADSYRWSRTIAGFLALHGLAATNAPAVA